MNLFENSFNDIATTIPFCSSPITNVAIIVTNVEIPSNHEESALDFFKSITNVSQLLNLQKYFLLKELNCHVQRR